MSSVTPGTAACRMPWALTCRREDSSPDNTVMLGQHCSYPLAQIIVLVILCLCGHNAWQMIVLRKKRLAWLRISEHFWLPWWGECVGIAEFMAARERSVICSLHGRPESREHTAGTSRLSPSKWYYQLGNSIQKLNYGRHNKNWLESWVDSPIGQLRLFSSGISGYT